MKLSDIAKKPQLVEITLDDEETVKEYGEAITFHTWDRQPMDVFMRLASLDQSDTGSIITAVKGLILNEQGQQVLTDEVSLPAPVMMRVITKVIDGLGKL